MKTKGYAKGGAKMMKAMGGRMMKSKGYAKGGAKMMKAMGGKMAKGYAKGGAKKVMKAKVGRAITGDRPMQKKRKVARQMTEQAFNAAAFARALRNRTADRVTARDVQEAMKQLRKK